MNEKVHIEINGMPLTMSHSKAQAKLKTTIIKELYSPIIRGESDKPLVQWVFDDTNYGNPTSVWM